MPEAAAAPATAPTPVVKEPMKAPPVAGAQGAAALANDPTKKAETVPDDPFEYDLTIKGQKQKVKFANKDQLAAVLQKALYADQTIKDATQAKKGAAEFMQKIKAAKDGDYSGLREIFNDPDIGVDIKKLGLAIVKDMMEDEKKYDGWTPEQMKAAERAKVADKLEAAQKAREEADKLKAVQEKNRALAQKTRTEIINAMKKYEDIPQTQATMDAVIQNMRAAFKRFGKHLTPEQAMTVYSQQYWKSLGSLLEKLPPEKIVEKFGQKTLERIQKFNYNILRQKTNPANKAPVTDGEVKKKKHMTEKEFDKHFQTLAGL